MTYAKFSKLTKRLQKNIATESKQVAIQSGSVVETIKTANGEVIKKQAYPLSSLSEAGEQFHISGVKYTVVSSVKSGNEITTIVK